MVEGLFYIVKKQWYEVELILCVKERNEEQRQSVIFWTVKIISFFWIKQRLTCAAVNKVSPFYILSRKQDYRKFKQIQCKFLLGMTILCTAKMEW